MALAGTFREREGELRGRSDIGYGAVGLSLGLSLRKAADCRLQAGRSWVSSKQ